MRPSRRLVYWRGWRVDVDLCFGLGLGFAAGFPGDHEFEMALVIGPVIVSVSKWF